MRNASRLHRIAGLLLLAFLWIPAAVAADILYVANVPLNAADQSIVDYVRAKGHYVVVIDDSAPVPDTTSTELIMISESVDPAVVGTKFNNLPVRILDWDAEMQYVLGMTGPIVNTDFGYSADDVRAHLVDHKHPLSGGLTGNDVVVFTGTAKPMGWGEPNKNAQIVARQVLGGKRPLLYEYAPGAKMVDGTNAPCNRIFFFMADNGIFGMTDSGKAFLDAILGYSITGGDFTAPVITPPANIFIEAVTLNDTIVNYPPATVTDNRDPNPTVSYSKASGTLFPLGVTTVIITAVDNVGNQSTASFTITIADTTPPTIGGGNIINGNLTAEATSAAGAIVTFVGATDLLDPNPKIVANPPSGSQFPLGVTTVNVTATDSSNNTATGSFTVTVQDTTAPQLTVPANVIADAQDASGGIVNYPAATATDAVTANPTITYSQNSGTHFPMGFTTVNVTAKDAAGNTRNGSFTVRVINPNAPLVDAGTDKYANAAILQDATVTNGGVSFQWTQQSGPAGGTLTFSSPNTEDTFISANVEGVYVARLTACNADGISGFDEMTFVWDVTPPSISLTTNIVIAEATGPNGAVVNYDPATVVDASPYTVTYSQNSGTLFPLGTTPVTVTATDAAGNSATATISICVQDTTPPVINSDVTAEATGPSGAVVNFIGATDLVDPNPSISANPASGSLFPLGDTLVTVSATDFSGNTANGSFIVHIVDTTGPTFTSVPSDQVVEANVLGGAVVTYPPATATDAVSNVTITYSHTSGSTFPLGQTIVTVTAADESGNATIATFKVTVQDTTPPVIGEDGTITNGNLTVEATGPNGAVVNFVGASDLADPNPTIVANPPSGSQFPLGVTTVSVTATDASGNSASGSFTITVVDTTAPAFTSVPSDQVAEATSPAGAVVNYPAATATDLVSAVTITYSKDSGTTFPLGDTIVTVTAKDQAGNTCTATFKVTVQDTTPPVIGQDGNILNGNLTVEATSPNGAIVNFVGATDLADPNPTIVANPPSGSQFPIGVTTVSVTATDASGNSASGTFTITVVDTTGPTFTSVPADQVVEATSAAGAVVNYPAATAIDPCSAVTITYSKDSGTTFPLGVTIVTITAKDVAGNTTIATFKVTVQDTTPPTIGDDGSGFGSGDIINGNMTVEATSPQGAIVTFLGATDLVDPNPTIVANPPSGSQFPIGVTTVNVTATDSAGNSASGSFTVTVVDTTGPVLSNIPADITIEATTPTGQTVTYPPASATDLTSTPSITYSKPSGSFFPLGDTIVTITATDAYNNSTKATFKVTVTPDHTPPVIIVPPNVTTEATNNGGAHVDYPPANTGDATDVDYDHPSGSHFPVGTTTVTVTATDDSGNTSTATFTVTVLDTHAPVIESPLTANPNPGVAGEPVIFTIIATDAQPLTYTWNFGDGTTLVESTGQVSHTFSAPSNYPVTVTVSDPGGLKATDTLELTVNVPADINGPGTSVARTKLPMLVTKLIGGAMFSKTGADRYMIAGFIPNTSKEFNPLGKTLILDVNGALTPFKLDAKGRAKTGTGRLSLKLKYKRNKATKKKEFVGGAIPFLARVSKGSWVNNWKSAGVIPTLSVKKGSINMLVDMTLDEVVYTSGSTCQYNAKAQKSGRFKYIYRKPRK